MFRLLPIFFLLACDDVVSNDIQQIPNEELPYFNISMLNERNYPMSVDGSVYSISKGTGGGKDNTGKYTSSSCIGHRIEKNNSLI